VIIQFVLFVGLMACVVYAISQHSRAPTASVVICIAAASGMLLVFVPEWSDAIAHAVGVGRGADLIFYCWLVISLIVSINLHVRLRDLQSQITALTRAVALQAPAYPPAQTDPESPASKSES